MSQGHSYLSDHFSGHTSIREQVFFILDKNPLLTAKELAVLTDRPYKKYRRYLTNLRSLWKYHHENEHASRCSDFHCYKAGVRLEGVEQPGRLEALKVGWVQSRASNRFFVFRERLGRVVWFETGTVRLFVRKPGNLGKAKQLFCDGFVNTGLISDIKVLNPVLERIGVKSSHFPYSTSQRLPHLEIRDFVDSHGILIKVGDRSHPNAVEVIAEFSDRQEKTEEKVGHLAEGLVKFMAEFSGLREGLNGNGVAKPIEEDYSS